MADCTCPRCRAEYLADLDAHEARERYERAAVPLRTGSLPADLTAADEAVERVERAADEAWTDMLAVRERAGTLPTTEQNAAIIRAEHRLDELRTLRQRAVHNRDGLIREFDAALNPRSVLPPGPEEW